jgi:hypothetical protein
MMYRTLLVDLHLGMDGATMRLDNHFSKASRRS